MRGRCYPLFYELLNLGVNCLLKQTSCTRKLAFDTTLLLLFLINDQFNLLIAAPVLCLLGSVSWSVHRSVKSTFNGQSLRLLHPQLSPVRQKASRFITMMVKPTIQFVQGTDEQTIPDVRLTKSKDGTNGVAYFVFDQPSVFDSSGELGDITGFYMIDEEGVLQSVDVNAKFVNGKPARIEAKYVMRSPQAWDRFMRFMERYANANGLQFVKK